MSIDQRALHVKVCSLMHTCVMSEHPDRPMCDWKNCDTVRMINYMVAKLEAPVASLRTAGIDAHMRTPWPEEKITEALQAVIPLVMEQVR